MRKLIRNRAIWLLVASFTILVTCFAQQPANTAANDATQNAAPPENTGEQTVSFTGYVRTSAGVGIPGASVRITNNDIKKSWATWTDAQGRFSLPALPPGHYHIEATQLGFATNTSDFTLSGYNEKPSLITLNVATLAQLNTPAQNGGAANASNANSPPTNGNGRGGFGNGGARGGFGRGGNRSGNGGPYAGSYGRGQGRGAQGQGGANANNQVGQNGQNAGQGSTFAQTDLTGITNSDDQAQQVGSGDQFGAEAALGANVNGNTADATVLQGGVAQGESFGGPAGFPGGPGGFGPGGPGSPGGIGGDIGFGTPGDTGAFTGAGGGAVGAGFAAGPGGAGGPGGGFGGRGGGPGGGGGGGGFGGRGGRGGGAGGLFAGGRGGRGAGAGRLFRQRANRYRYAFYDTYNNSALNARPFSFNTTEVPKVATYNENFGGDLQGPFKIPHLYDGTGRTNVFLNYEHRTNESAANNYSIVPTDAERTGNFCGIVGGFFNPYNPTGSQLPCNLALATNPQTGSGAFVPNAAAVGLLNPSYIPLPNFNGQTTQGYNYLLQLRTPSNTDIVNARIMHTINSKFNLTGVYAANIARSKSIGSFPDTIGNTSTLGQSITLTLNHNWSARTVERTNASWSRSRSQLSSLTQYGTDLESELGIQGASPLPVNFGLPQISFQSAGTLSQPVPSLTRNQTLLLGDTVSFYKTKHTFIIGGQVRDIDLNNNASPNPRGTFAFNGDFTCGSAFADGTSGTVNGVAPCTGTKTTPVQLTPQQTVAYEMADFLIGLPYTASAQYGTPQNIYLRSWGFAAYAQDDFRMTKTFTLQYGLRWDATKPTVEKYDHIANLVPSFGANGALTGVTVVTPRTDGLPRALVNGAYKNFGPRTGFAWILPEKKKRTVVRGGYSIFYNVNTFTSLVRDFSFQPPFDTSFTLQNSSSNYFTIQNGLTAPSTSAVTVTNSYAVDPNYKPYRAQTWNIGTETDLSRNWVLDLQYTGTAGANLDIWRSPNRAPLGTSLNDLQQSLSVPNATQFTYISTGATSLYNGLQVRVVHRYTHGISFQGQYTYSKSLDDASTVGGGGGLKEQIDGDMAGLRGLSSFDQRHNFRGTATYELPFGQRYRFANHGLTNKLFGDWRLLNTVTWHTGNPLTVLMGGQNSDPSGTGASGFALPNQIGDPNVAICGGSVAAFFDTDVFATPAAKTFGEARKGSVEGPCSVVWNASMNKAFRIGNTDNQRRGEIEWNVSNVLNHVNYSGISTSLGTAQFGQVTSAGAMRSMSLTLRFNF